MQPINILPAPFVANGTCFLVDHALAAEACASIVQVATESGFSLTAVDYPPSYRDNDRSVMTDAALAAALFERLRDVLPSELRDAATGCHRRLVGLNERFRLCRYHDGQSFRIHQDGAHARSPGVRSRLTLQIYLDEDFTGGTTRFYTARRGALLGAVVAQTGRAIVFDHALWHDGEAVTRGTKHVLRTDVIYEDVASANAPASPDELRGHEGYVFCVVPLADGSLASGSRDRTIRRWTRSASGWAATHVLTGHDASVLALAEVGPGVIASASRDRTVRTFDLATGRHRILANLDGAVLALAQLDDGVLAAGAADGVISLLDRDGVRLRDLVGHRGWVWTLARTASGRLVAGSDDGTVRLWDPASGECIAAASPGRGACHAIAALAGDRVACGFADGHVVVYSVVEETLAPVAVLAAHEGEVYALAALEDGSLATGGEDSMARLLRAADGEVLSSYSLGGFARSICGVPGTRRIAVASYDGTIRMLTCSR